MWKWLNRLKTDYNSWKWVKKGNSWQIYKKNEGKKYKNFLNT